MYIKRLEISDEHFLVETCIFVDCHFVGAKARKLYLVEEENFAIVDWNIYMKICIFIDDTDRMNIFG